MFPWRSFANFILLFDWQWAVYFAMEARLRLRFMFPFRFNSIRNKTVYSLETGTFFFLSHCLLPAFGPISNNISFATLNMMRNGRQRKSIEGFSRLKALNKYFIRLVFFVLDWFQWNTIINKWMRYIEEKDSGK